MPLSQAPEKLSHCGDAGSDHGSPKISRDVLVDAMIAHANGTITSTDHATRTTWEKTLTLRSPMPVRGRVPLGGRPPAARWLSRARVVTVIVPVPQYALRERRNVRRMMSGIMRVKKNGTTPNADAYPAFPNWKPFCAICREITWVELAGPPGPAVMTATSA